MRLRKELVSTTILIDDACFTVTELGTSNLTAVSLANLKGKEAALMETITRAVTAWTNVDDESGEKIECTEENKALIFEANNELVKDLMEKYPDAISNARETQKKILSAGAKDT